MHIHERMVLGIDFQTQNSLSLCYPYFLILVFLKCLKMAVSKYLCTGSYALGKTFWTRHCINASKSVWNQNQ